MRKYIYNTLAVLMLTLCSVSIKAQELKASITWAESNNCKPVYANDIWHIVQGTQATVTLETTVPDNTNEKRYEPGVIYKKGQVIHSVQGEENLLQTFLSELDKFKTK